MGVVTREITVGPQSVEILGYNTHFEEAQSSLQCYLKSDALVICGQIDRPIDATHLLVTFEIPEQLPKAALDFYANNDIDGTLFLPNAFLASAVKLGAAPALCHPHIGSHEHSAFGFPFQPILFESIRNLLFHVPMWFTMFLLMGIAIFQALRNLASGNPLFDLMAHQAIKTGLLFCVLGLITGSLWARFTWGSWWVNDPQLNGALVTFLIYSAYLILRNSIEDEEKRARISGIYSIFAFAMLVTLLMILPRYSESLHPGQSGNPGFNTYDLDSSLRLVFYPAVIGWMLLGYWIYNLNVRLGRIQKHIHDEA